MKKILYAMLISAAVLATSCSSDNEEIATGDGFGNVQFTVAASGEVDAVTRAQVELPTTAIPNSDLFALHITGTYNDDMGNPQNYDRTWATVGVFDSPKMRSGNYTAAITYGTRTAEGENAACFSGTQNFTIFARRTVTANITATLQNAAFKVVFTDWFKKYYTNAQITLRTTSGSTFTFSPSSTSVIFVKPGTDLFLKGTATKSQTGTAVEFPEVKIGTTVARTLHTITVDASKAGGGALVIDLNDTFTEVPEKVIELNPAA
ncbi:MAG: DUF4493 domain-containing protein [Alistipes sp.]